MTTTTRPGRRDRLAVTSARTSLVLLVLAVACYVVPLTVPLPDIVFLLVYASPWVLLASAATATGSVFAVHRRSRGRWSAVLLARAWLLAWTSFVALWGAARVLPGAFYAESTDDPADYYVYGWPLRWVIERREQAAGGPAIDADYGWDVLAAGLWVDWALCAAVLLAVALGVARLRRGPRPDAVHGSGEGAADPEDVSV